MPGYMETGGSRSCQRHAQTEKPLSVGRSFRTSQVRSRKPKPRTHKAGRCPLRPTATELSRAANDAKGQERTFCSVRIAPSSLLSAIDLISRMGPQLVADDRDPRIDCKRWPTKVCAILSLANRFIGSFEEHVGAVAGLQKLLSRRTGSKHGCAEHTSGYLQITRR
jgi:hypothetical protein